MVEIYLKLQGLWELMISLNSLKLKVANMDKKIL